MKEEKDNRGEYDVRYGEGKCLFYRVETKTYNIVLGKVVGSIFEFSSSPPSSHAFLSLPFYSYASPFVFRERHKFLPEKYNVMTREPPLIFLFLPPSFLKLNTKLNTTAFDGNGIIIMLHLLKNRDTLTTF